MKRFWKFMGALGAGIVEFLAEAGARTFRPWVRPWVKTPVAPAEKKRRPPRREKRGRLVVYIHHRPTTTIPPTAAAPTTMTVKVSRWKHAGIALLFGLIAAGIATNLFGWELVGPDGWQTAGRWYGLLVFAAGFAIALFLLRRYWGTKEVEAEAGETKMPAAATKLTGAKKEKSGLVFLQIVIIILAVADVLATHGWFGFYWLAPLLLWIVQGAKNGNAILRQFLIFGGPIISGSVKLLWAGIWGIMTLTKFLLEGIIG